MAEGKINILSNAEGAFCNRKIKYGPLWKICLHKVGLIEYG